ncbi:pentapeptide repeat-containing protein [Sinomonas atrocyanea]|uniref:pentapeptide repeat-containing protein n=1 Tax=Sinomonas atrocyanea TaxID=37927 RepID=UPI003D96CE66
MRPPERDVLPGFRQRPCFAEAPWLAGCACAAGFAADGAAAWGTESGAGFDAAGTYWRTTSETDPGYRSSPWACAAVVACAAGVPASGASTSGASASGASVSGASISGASASGASVSGASASGASVSGASASGASVSGASVSGASDSGASADSDDSACGSSAASSA